MANAAPQPTPRAFRRDAGSASSEEDPPHVPVVALDRDGTIKEITRSAQTALEYSPEESIQPCFFSHVHGQNLRRVMRDLALMVSHRKQRARWLLRLRTGNQRWRWYRAVAHNHLDQPEETVRVKLRPV